MMKKALFSTLGVLALAGACTAAPQQCTAVENIDVNTIAGGCIAGAYLFNNFDWTAAGISPNQGPVVITGIFFRSGQQHLRFDFRSAAFRDRARHPGRHPLDVQRHERN
jgi:hypothetical protein